MAEAGRDLLNVFVDCEESPFRTGAGRAARLTTWSSPLPLGGGTEIKLGEEYQLRLAWSNRNILFRELTMEACGEGIVSNYVGHALACHGERSSPNVSAGVRTRQTDSLRHVTDCSIRTPTGRSHQLDVVLNCLDHVVQAARQDLFAETQGESFGRMERHV
jgi:hypothetical protein